MSNRIPIVFVDGVAPCRIPGFELMKWRYTGVLIFINNNYLYVFDDADVRLSYVNEVDCFRFAAQTKPELVQCLICTVPCVPMLRRGFNWSSDITQPR